MLIKYKLGDVAKDFGKQNRQLMGSSAGILPPRGRRNTPPMPRRSFGREKGRFDEAGGGGQTDAFFAEAEKKYAKVKEERGEKGEGEGAEARVAKPVKQAVVVDTRQSNVNLDTPTMKKYERIAPAQKTNKQPQQNKQKLNQRSAQRTANPATPARMPRPTSCAGSRFRTRRSVSWKSPSRRRLWWRSWQAA